MSRRCKPRILLPRVNRAAFDAAMAPLGEEFTFQPWGYICAEFDPQPEPESAPASLLDLRPDDTQFLTVRDFVLATEFPLSADQAEAATC